LAGVTDILHAQPLLAVLLHLGYPPYFGTLLGVWKLLGAAALLAPRYPLVKEWAYAGLFFDFTAAMVSHLAAGDGAGALIGPTVLTVLLAGSYFTRPQSRRLARTEAGGG
jgi:hypothetical protein